MGAPGACDVCCAGFAVGFMEDTEDINMDYELFKKRSVLTRYVPYGLRVRETATGQVLVVDPFSDLLPYQKDYFNVDVLWPEYERVGVGRLLCDPGLVPLLRPVESIVKDVVGGERLSVLVGRQLVPDEEWVENEDGSAESRWWWLGVSTRVGGGLEVRLEWGPDVFFGLVSDVFGDDTTRIRDLHRVLDAWLVDYLGLIDDGVCGVLEGS